MTTTSPTEPDSTENTEYVVTATIRTTTRNAAAALKNGLGLYIAQVTDPDDRYIEATVSLEASDTTPGDDYARSLAQAVVDEQERRRQSFVQLAVRAFEPCDCDTCSPVPARPDVD